MEDDDETVRRAQTVINETDNPLGTGTAHLRVVAHPTWRPDRANTPPSFPLGVKPKITVTCA